MNRLRVPRTCSRCKTQITDARRRRYVFGRVLCTTCPVRRYLHPLEWLSMKLGLNLLKKRWRKPPPITIEMRTGPSTPGDAA